MDFSFLCMDDYYKTPVAGCFGSLPESHTYLDSLVFALSNTVKLSVLGLIVAIIVGVIIGTIRTLPPTSIFNKFLRIFARVWVEVLRNIPLLVQLFCWFFVFNKIYTPLSSVPPFYLVVLGLGFFTSARIAEQVRSGIESIPTGQRYAAMAMGFNTFQTYRYVILPRAMRTIFPPLISESMGIVKNSAVAFALTISELIQYQTQIIEDTSRVYENYIIVTVLYVLIALVIFVVMSIIERMIKIPGFQTEGH